MDPRNTANQHKSQQKRPTLPIATVLTASRCDGFASRLRWMRLPAGPEVPKVGAVDGGWLMERHTGRRWVGHRQGRMQAARCCCQPPLRHPYAAPRRPGAHGFRTRAAQVDAHFSPRHRTTPYALCPSSSPARTRNGGAVVRGAQVVLDVARPHVSVGVPRHRRLDRLAPGKLGEHLRASRVQCRARRRKGWGAGFASVG